MGQLEGTMAKAGAKVELRAVTAQSTAPEGESTVESSRSLFAEVLCFTVTRDDSGEFTVQQPATSHHNPWCLPGAILLGGVHCGGYIMGAQGNCPLSGKVG